MKITSVWMSQQKRPRYVLSMRRTEFAGTGRLSLTRMISQRFCAILNGILNGLGLKRGRCHNASTKAWPGRASR